MQTIEDLETELRDMKVDYDNAVSQNDYLTLTMLDLDQTILNYKESNINLKSDLCNLTATNEDLNDEIQDLEQELRDSENTNTYLEQDVRDLNQTITNLQTDLLNYKNEYDSNRGLWCVDINPAEVDIEYIRDNCFQL